MRVISEYEGSEQTVRKWKERRQMMASGIDCLEKAWRKHCTLNFMFKDK